MGTWPVAEIPAYDRILTGVNIGQEMIAMALPQRSGSGVRDSYRTSRGTGTVMTIEYGGRRFVATQEMAEIFLRHAREVIERGEAQLVPLRHLRGIEFLLVSRATPYWLANDDG